MNESSTESGRMIIATSADRAWNRNTRQMIATMIPSSISVSGAACRSTPRISSERS